jgi:hypothetical protein
VTTTKDQTVAAGHSVDVDPARWQQLFDELMSRVAGRFARVELRQRARAFVPGLLALLEHTQHPPPSGLIPLTCNEIQHLFAAVLVQPTGDLAHRLRWSLWRRRHEARARTCHYRRRAALQP